MPSRVRQNISPDKRMASSFWRHAVGRKLGDYLEPGFFDAGDPSTGGTRKCSPSVAGAVRTATSGSSDGTISSARHRLSMSSAVVIGSTSSVSSSESCSTNPRMLFNCGPIDATSSSLNRNRASLASFRMSSSLSATSVVPAYFLAVFFSPTSNGFVLTVLRTTPLRMHCVQTRIDLLVPLGSVTWTF